MSDRDELATSRSFAPAARVIVLTAPFVENPFTTTYGDVPDPVPEPQGHAHIRFCVVGRPPSRQTVSVRMGVQLCRPLFSDSVVFAKIGGYSHPAPATVHARPLSTQDMYHQS